MIFGVFDFFFSFYNDENSTFHNYVWFYFDYLITIVETITTIMIALE